MSTKVAVFAATIRSTRLAMTLYNPEEDTLFLLDLRNSAADESPLPLSELLRLYRNITLSPHNLHGLTSPCPATYIIRLGDEYGERIGQVNLSERNPNIAPDLGYAISPAYRRQGYAVEAALAVKNYWLSFGIKEMTAFCAPDNVASNAILRKIGFERAGEALMDGKIVVSAFVLPGMKYLTVQTAKFSRMGIDK